MIVKSHKVIKVLVEHSYLVEMLDDKHSTINGWTPEQIAQEWFRNPRYSLNAYHASREAYEIGGGRIVKNISIVNGDEYFESRKEKPVTKVQEGR